VLVELVVDGRHRAGAEALLERYAHPRTVPWLPLFAPNGA
jgi:hypothetical protein